MQVSGTESPEPETDEPISPFARLWNPSSSTLALLEYTNVGAFIIRIGFWGPLYYKYDKEPQNGIGNYLGPYIRGMKSGMKRTNAPVVWFRGIWVTVPAAC